MSVAILVVATALAVGGCAAVLLRVRERKHRALRAEALATRARLQAGLAAGGVSVFAVSREGDVRWFEGAAIPGSVIGRSALLGRSAWEALRDWSELVAALRSGLAGERGLRRVEVGGTSIDATYSPRFDDRGRVVEAVVVLRDVTLEQEEADRAERLAEVRSRILAVMSYRLRGQISGIIGATELAARAERSQARSWLAGIERGGERMLAYTEHLIDFLELDAGRMTAARAPFSLRQVVDEAASRHRARADEDGTTFVVRYPPHLPGDFEGDATRLGQAVDLLLTVALGTNARGQVILNVDATAEAAGTARVTVSVEDSGRGLTAEARARVFDAFDSASALWATRSGSSGLELPLARRLAALLGGDLRVDSAPGAGTALRLTLTLPRALGLRDTGDDGLQGPVEPGTLLVVDDDAHQRAITRALAEALGWRVLEAGHGREALQLLDAGERVECVLTELHMPVCDGFALLAALRERRNDGVDVPAGVLTADARPDSRARALAAGARTVALKPARTHDLALALARLHQRPRQSDVASGGDHGRDALDGVTLQRLHDFDPIEGPEVVRELSEAFISAAPIELIGLADALAAGDLEARERLLESLQVSARLLGAPALAQALHAISASPPSDAAAQRDSITAVATEVQAVRTALAAALASGVTAPAPEPQAGQRSRSRRHGWPAAA